MKELVFACSGFLGHEVLRHIYRRHNIRFVLTDKKSIEIIDFCNKNKIENFIGNPGTKNCLSITSQHKNRVLFSVNYLFLFSAEFLNNFNERFNIHGSLLPKYRGRTPHVWAIINNENKTGITIHNISEECDAGDICFQKEIRIAAADTGASILNKYAKAYPKLINDFLFSLYNNSIKYKKQDPTLATFFGKRTPEDGHINWEWQRERIYNWVRALAPPYPCGFSFFKGNKILIEQTVFSEHGFSCNLPNGMILKISDNNIIVKTPNGAVQATVGAGAETLIEGGVLS